MKISIRPLGEARYTTIRRHFSRLKTFFFNLFLFGSILQIWIVLKNSIPRTAESLNLCQNHLQVGSKCRHNSHFEFQFGWVVAMALQRRVPLGGAATRI